MSYFNSKLNFFHGVMFHHFHDDKLHLKGQGSINKETLINIINFIGRENIIDADDFYHRYKENKLTDKNVCLTFDDGIKCQSDIAIPVLEDFKIKAFFFIYTSLFDNDPDYLEVYRYFRLNFFNSIDEFYKYFYNLLGIDLENFFSNKKELITSIKYKYNYYSIEDIKFRLVRDLYLNKEDYKNLMLEMFQKKKFIPSKIFNKIFFNTQTLKNIYKLGHKIGMHSHTHPTLIEKLDFGEQLKEYSVNKKKLSEILNIDSKEIKYMSHPCGSYNKNTLKILNTLNIEIGFKNIINVEKSKGMKQVNNSNLEIARYDHALIVNKMN